MFEKCGILDILYAIRKYAVALVAVVMAFLVLGTALSVVAAKKNPPPPPTQPEQEEEQPIELVDQWVASVCFDVAVHLPSSATVEDQQLANSKAASSLFALVKADFTREYIYNTLLKTYSKEDIVAAFNLEVEPQNLTHFDLKSVLEGSILSSTSIVNLYIHSFNKQLSDDYLALAKAKVAEQAAVMKNVTLSSYGGVSSAIKVPAPLKEEEEEEPVTQEDPYKVSFTKYWLLLPFLALFLAVLAIVFKAMFFPTVNRRSDIAAYDLPVLAEIDRRTGKKRLIRSLSFNARCLADFLQDNHIRTLAVVTTLKDTALVKQALTDIAASLQEKGRAIAVVSSPDELAADCESAFVFAGNLDTNPAALDVVSQCDRVLLVEKYGATTHRAFYEITDVLKMENCSVVGVATI